MGRLAAIANPYAIGLPGSCRFSAEQRVGRGAVGRHLVTVRLDPDNFGFERCDAFVQLVLGIRGEVFGSELAGGIALGARKVSVIHCWANIAREAACCQSAGAVSRAIC